MKSFKVTILGGGPSGLGVALGLVESGVKDILLIEKESKLGGLSGSFKIDDFILDYGPHRFSPEFPELVDKLRDLLGDDLLEVGNEHAVVFGDRVYAYPPRVKQFLHWDSARFFTKAFGSYVYRKISKTGNSDPDFPQRIRNSFGDVLFNEVISPLCTKVWGEPAQLNPAFAELRFSIPTFVSWGKGLLKARGARDTVFYYPKKGFQEIWNAFAEYLKKEGVTIELATAVESVETQGDRIRSLTVKRGGSLERVETEWLVSTIPATSLVHSMGMKDAPLLLDTFKNRGMLLVVFLLDCEISLPARVVIFPEAKFSFNRLSEQNQFSPDTVPEGRSAVEADILTETNSPLWKLSDEEIKDKVTQEVLSLGFFDRSVIAAVSLVRVPVAYPVPTKEREEGQRLLQTCLDKFENLLCTGRFASSDYNNSHTALKRGMLGAQFIIGKLNRTQWNLASEKIRHLAIRD